MISQVWIDLKSFTNLGHFQDGQTAEYLVVAGAFTGTDWRRMGQILSYFPFHASSAHHTSVHTERIHFHFAISRLDRIIELISSDFCPCNKDHTCVSSLDISLIGKERKKRIRPFFIFLFFFTGKLAEWRHGICFADIFRAFATLWSDGLTFEPNIFLLWTSSL